jgi:hypothetical protein
MSMGTISTDNARNEMYAIQSTKQEVIAKRICTLRAYTFCCALPLKRKLVVWPRVDLCYTLSTDTHTCSLALRANIWSHE